jgi:H-type lectin domain-containing protein
LQLPQEIMRKDLLSGAAARASSTRASAWLLKSRYHRVKNQASLLLTLFVLGLFEHRLSTALGQSTGFTYQGRFTDHGTNYTGTVEFQPTLWTAQSNGTLVAGNNPSTVLVSVNNGLFVLPLDFGMSFPGTDRWLQLEARTNLSTFTLLSPRQQLTPTPYAIFAQNVGSGGLAAGTYSNALTLNNPANNLSGNGAGLTALNASQLTTGVVPPAALSNAWKTGGNSGTAPGTQFVGTTDNQPLEFKVNALRGLRLEPATNGTVNVIGGAGNFVAPGISGATIAGGGAVNYAGLGFAFSNQIYADFASIGGGLLNVIQANGESAVIAGGHQNLIQSNSSIAVIAGGYRNSIGTNASGSVIGGGNANTNNGGYAIISGGTENAVLPDSPASVNQVISGGVRNLAMGYAGTVPGGAYNFARGAYTLAAGYHATAWADGCFTWADESSASEFASTAANQFLIRAAGGVGIGTNAPGAQLDVAGSVRFGVGGSVFSRIQSGRVDVGQNAAGGVATVTVTFPTAFSSTPRVLLTVQGDDYSDTFAVTARAVTNTGLKINVLRLDSLGSNWGQDLSVNWLAWE